ncbi:hypothetical protein EDD69_10760 [Thermolongibacillus altinsuensis]|jgi:hypothetical protein|uniref:Uncharacterized protein n=1 Tax=Thermolongibacillus altinsuensis TaxID=575256 RepID=A0A4R1QDV5_9BACL|nr:hypothetical protein EDD69_10760 [Thermolongibacillus altinsuensis]
MIKREGGDPFDTVETTKRTPVESAKTVAKPAWKSEIV